MRLAPSATTVDGGRSHRPRSFVPRSILRPAAWLLLVGFLSACRARPEVRLALLGDINLGRGVAASEASLALLAEDLSGADLALANLESPLANIPPAQGPAAGYNLCVLDPPAGLLAGWGLDLLALANNHRFDCGPDGPFETASLLQAAGLTPLGPGPAAVRMEVNGLSLAFLAFDDASAPLDLGAAAAAIRGAAADGALVVVSVHWGAEYQGAPTPRQEALARELAAAGAALVWGHHPHVLQRGEWIGGTLVLYSLGNALFDQGGLDDTRLSALLLVTLDQDGVSDVQALPFEIDLQASRAVEPGAGDAGEILERLKLPPR